MRTEKLGTYFVVNEGEKIEVDTLLIKVKDIISLTAQGCLDGPVECMDSIELETSSGSGSEIITLSMREGVYQREYSEKVAGAYHILLAKITQDTATIGVFVMNSMPLGTHSGRTVRTVSGTFLCGKTNNNRSCSIF